MRLAVRLPQIYHFEVAFLPDITMPSLVPQELPARLSVHMSRRVPGEGRIGFCGEAAQDHESFQPQDPPE